MWKKTANYLRMLLLSLSFIFLLRSGTVSAAVMGAAENYELGEEYRGNIYNDEKVRYFRFALQEKSHVTLYLNCAGKGCTGAIYNELGKEVLRKGDLVFETNFFTGWSSAQLSRTLPPGVYCLGIWNEGKWKWQNYQFSFRVQAQKQLRLEKGVLDSLDSAAAGQLTVNCEAAENAIGYRIEYSMDERLKEGVKIVHSPTAEKIIKGLRKGKRYYVKVCPYTIYDDGTYVYGENSFVKAAVTKK